MFPHIHIMYFDHQKAFLISKNHFCYCVVVILRIRHVISIYTHIIPWLGSSPPVFSILLHSPSKSDFNRFQCSMFILVEKIHQPYSHSLLLLKDILGDGAWYKFVGDTAWLKTKKLEAPRTHREIPLISKKERNDRVEN
jgi:hypothetical protein